MSNTQENNNNSEPNRLHWIERLSESLAEGFEDDTFPVDLYNDLVTTMGEFLDATAQDNPTQARVLLPIALRRATGRAPQVETAAKRKADDTGDDARALHTYLDKNISSRQCLEVQDVLINAMGNPALPPGVYEALEKGLDVVREKTKATRTSEEQKLRNCIQCFADATVELLANVRLPKNIYNPLATWTNDVINLRGFTDVSFAQNYLAEALLGLARAEDERE